MAISKIYQFRVKFRLKYCQFLASFCGSLFRLRTNFDFKTRPDQFCNIFEPFLLVRNVFFDNFGLFSLKTTFFSLTRPIFNYFFGLRYYFETRLDGWLKVNVQSCFCIIYISLIIIRVQLEALKKSKTFQNLHFLVVNRPSLDPSLVFLSVLQSWMWQNNPGKSDLDFDILE